MKTRLLPLFLLAAGAAFASPGTLSLAMAMANSAGPAPDDRAGVAAAAPTASATASATDAVQLAIPLTRDHLLASLGRQLAAHFNLEGDLDLELLRDWNPPSRVAQTWTVTVTDFPMLASSSMLVRARVFADGKLVDEPTFVLRASLWRDAWATRAPLTTGATFDPNVLEARRVDMFREHDALPAAVGDRSYIFARAVDAGRLLTWHDISRRPLVKRGQTVDVTAADGMLIVTMKAVAMENGAQGDTVTVRNPESLKNFSATVIDE
ncbi:MAG TPA: flagellar basal body P-ring formation chaperone FlgA, partial [Opitutaceae bacterium]|nr:flagellar basal body P-ring formation chaperone FlgA [Opitutaceae bacterium]